MDSDKIQDNPNNTIDLKEILNLIWEKRIMATVASALISIGSVIFTLSLTPEYTAVLYLTEVKKDKEISLSSAATDDPFGFSLPGSLGGGNGLSQEMNTSIIMMKSWDFIDEFIRLNKLEVPLLAGEGWDPSSRKLLIDSSKYNELTEEWIDTSFDVNSPAVRWEMYKEFLKEIKILADKTTGVHRLSINSYSPELSLEWGNLFYQQANEKMRQKKLSTIDNNIENLQKQISLNSNAALRDRLYDVQSQQIRTKSMIEASPEYVFELIGNPLVPHIRSFPKRTLLVVAITFVGTIFIIFAIVLRGLIIQAMRKF